MENVKKIFVGKIQLPDSLVIALAQGNGYGDAPQKDILKAVQIRLDCELEKLQRPPVLREPHTSLIERLATINALRWILDLSEEATKAVNGA